jgi:hypothetical protein
MRCLWLKIKLNFFCLKPQAYSLKPIFLRFCILGATGKFQSFFFFIISRLYTTTKIDSPLEVGT